MRTSLRWLAALATMGALLSAASSAGAVTGRCAHKPGPGVNLRGCDLSKRQFEYADFRGADLSRANLTGASLFDAVLFGANLSGANLTNANLATANFTAARLNHATITGATIVQANFSETTLVAVASGGVHGRPSVLPGRFFMKSGLLIGPGVDLSGQSLAHLDLHHANLARADLAHANLSGANLTRTILSGTNLVGAVLRGATITDTGFRGATLFKPNVPGITTGGLIGMPRKLPVGFALVDGYFVGPGANLFRANLTHALLAKVNLTGANLDAANFANSVLWGAEFSVTAMRDVGFAGASLNNSNFSNLDLSTAILRGTSLTGIRSSLVRSRGLPPGWVNVKGHLVGPGANLEGANLSHGVFSRAVLYGTILTGANLSGATLVTASLRGCFSGRLIVRGPAPSLPRAWMLFRGFLAGPGANLPGARFENAKLAHVGPLLRQPHSRPSRRREPPARESVPRRPRRRRVVEVDRHARGTPAPLGARRGPARSPLSHAAARRPS